MIRKLAAQRGSVVAVAMAVLVALGLPACGEGDAGLDLAAEPPDPAGALTGELTVHLFNLGDRSAVLHTLRLRDGQQRELRFAAPPDLPSGVRLRVFGADDGRVVQVSRFEQLEVELTQQALLDGTRKPSKRWAFVLIDTGAGVNITRQAAMERLFSDRPDSIRSYYREVSYGLQELSGDVLGPFRITPPAGGLCENFVSVVQSLLPMLSGAYDQYLWYFGSRISGCPWAGVAQLGTAAGPTKHSFYNASSECAVLVQEPGHNFGMVHSSSLSCTRLDDSATSMISGAEEGQCSHSEYGNPFDPMGGGGGSGSSQMLNRCYHMNGVQKSYQDWLGGCNIVKATTSGRFTIYPLEKACEGVQVLQVPLPAERALRFPPSSAATLVMGVISSYYVELRAPVGLDAPLQTPRVFIVAAEDLRGARSRGNPNWLIDTTPETRSVLDAALAVGKTFSDPAPNGPRITLISADATKAVVQVQLGATGGGALEAPGVGACSDDTQFTAPGPSQCADSAPIPDAGAPDAGTDAATGFIPPNPFGGGAAPTSPAGTGSAQGLEGAGCGCRVAGEPSPPSPWLLLLGVALLFRRLRWPGV